VDKKADRPFRDTLQEASTPLLSTGNEEGTNQSAQTVGEPAGLDEPKAEIPELVNLLETGAQSPPPTSERPSHPVMNRPANLYLLLLESQLQGRDTNCRRPIEYTEPKEYSRHPQLPRFTTKSGDSSKAWSAYVPRAHQASSPAPLHGLDIGDCAASWQFC